MNINTFDWEYYISINNDLNKLNTKELAYNHYINYGINENRLFRKNNLSQNIENTEKKLGQSLKENSLNSQSSNLVYEKSSLININNFDWEHYISTYNDLKQFNTRELAYNHYIKYGIHENRSCRMINDILILEKNLIRETVSDKSPIIFQESIGSCNVEFQLLPENEVTRCIVEHQNNKYDETFQSVKKNLSDIFDNSIETLNKFNMNEINLKNLDSFDWKYYISIYDDLKHLKTEKDALNHYINNGINEKRMTHIDANFDWIFYLNMYPELKTKNIDTQFKAYKHYINHGIKENRHINSDTFDIYYNFDHTFYNEIFNLDDNKYSKNKSYNHWIKNKDKYNHIRKISYCSWLESIRKITPNEYDNYMKKIKFNSEWTNYILIEDL